MGHRTSFAGGVIAALFGIAPAQSVWRLPARGAVEYRRGSEVAVGPVVASAAAARACKVDFGPRESAVPERYFPRVAPAPWLCQGELDDRQSAVLGPVRDLRDVLRAIAFDLGPGGGRGKFARVVPYGDLSVSGSWSRSDSDGTQQLRATIRGSRPSPIGGEDREVAERLQSFCARDCSGRLTLSRRLDAERGIVAAFAGEIDLVVDEGNRRYRRVRVTDAWDVVAVRYNQDADFRRRVAAAIEQGAGFVRAAVTEDASYLGGRVADRRSYGSGRLALGLLTMLHGHVPAGDPAVSRGFQELQRRNLVDSYSLAAALMAMARLGSAPGRQLTDRERQTARKWLTKLLKNVDPRTDPEDVLRFNYVRAPRYDTSVQQYGLLGLYAAQRSGVAVEGAAFAAAARQLLAVQCPSSGRHAHRVFTYDALAAAAGEEAPGELHRTVCRGFAYVDPEEPPFGSMTSAGISGLLLARAGMAAADHRDRALERDIDQAVEGGFGWLSREFSVRCNPGYAERGRYHWYYWLYCLERSCELSGIARLAERDWYYEGALQLMAQQQPDGAFKSDSSSGLQLDATCFAVLFLAKATGRAAITGR